ncbi:hypothetical protein RJZ56_005595 [Blastomyces dermatitidis]
MARSDISPDTSNASPRSQQTAHDEETPLLLSDFPSAGGSFTDEESRVSDMMSSSPSPSGSGFSLTTAAPETYLANNSLLAISLSILYPGTFVEVTIFDLELYLKYRKREDIADFKSDETATNFQKLRSLPKEKGVLPDVALCIGLWFAL